jgi:L-fucose isomerase
MAKQSEAKCLPNIRKATPKVPVIGVFATSDPRIDKESRKRCQNIVKMAADTISGSVLLPDKTPVPVVYSDVLVDGEAQADIVAQQFRNAGVDILVLVPDTWAFPQLTGISLLQQFGPNTPINITCGNSGPKPGVVYAHALNGAISQYGRMVSLNVGTWPDTGSNPKMIGRTAKNLIDWCYAAVTAVALRGRRVVILGHDSMGMETALAHVIPTRNTFGLEITRLDMKLLADMLNKKAYNQKELKELRAWIDKYIGKRLELRDEADSERFNRSLGMYLIVRDLMADLNAVGGGFMSQLEWGSDPRGIPLPVADAMESLFNSTFDHKGRKAPLPFATEADVQGLLTMLFMTYLSGGNPPLFMDFRKVWEAWEIKELAKKIGMKKLDTKADWYNKGLVDGDNSGSASFDWAAEPGASVKKIMDNIAMPLAEDFYFPGGGNAVNFLTPAGIEGIAARSAYSSVTGLFSFIWDEAHTTEVPAKLAKAMCRLTTPIWPHTFVVPKYASMTEYKQYPPANHFHMTWNLPVARLQHWMDLTGVLSVAPWAARPKFIEGVDRPGPLIHLINGGEDAYKILTVRK